MSQSPPPPPPPGGYGSPPPPPPGGGYGGPPEGGGYGGYGGPPQGGGPYGGPPANPSWDLGSAVNYGWSKFQANAGQIVVAALALVVGVIAVFFLLFFVQAALTDYSTSFFVLLVLNALISAVVFVVAQVIGAGLIRGALDITEGRPFTAATVFKFQNVGNVVVTALIVGAAVLVGTILCYLPGIIAGFVTSYSLYFVVDKNMAPMDAVKASFDLVKNHLGETVVWYIVGGLIAMVGFVLCGIGALVSVPVVLIGTAFTYKKLTGQPVAP